MKSSSVLAVYLKPNLATIRFGLKGIVAMGLSLYVTMLMDFDRPYWAMISAVFLLMRPENGMVIQKGVFQFCGNVIGGIIGLVILSYGLQHRMLALGSVALVIFVLSTLASRTRDFNITYLYAMIATTMGMVVLMTESAAPTSAGAFTIAVSRVTEIGIGVACATGISLVMWPQDTHPRMMADALSTLKAALKVVHTQLDAHETDERHAAILNALDAIMALQADTGPVFYEGPTGPRRVRAAHLLSQRGLSLIADANSMAYRERGEVNQILSVWIDKLRDELGRMLDSDDPKAMRAELAELRQSIIRQPLDAEASVQQQYTRRALLSLMAHLIVLCDACQLIESPEPGRALNARPPRTRQDWLPAMTVGLRCMSLFIIAATIWLATGWNSAIMMMLIPVVLGTMLAQLPHSDMLVMRALQGAAVAFPIAIIFGNVLLANTMHAFECLLMIFGLPLFIALFGFTARQTFPQTLGFCMTYIIMTMPGNHMTFDVTGAMERGLALMIGFTLLMVLFRSIPVPRATAVHRRLYRAMLSDLRQVGSKRDEAERFNSNMLSRLQQLGSYERSARDRLPWHWVEQGLLAFAIGHLVMQVRALFRASQIPDHQRVALQVWQQRVTRHYDQSVEGQFDSAIFEAHTRDLIGALGAWEGVDADVLEHTEFVCKRIGMMLREQQERCVLEVPIAPLK